MAVCIDLEPMGKSNDRASQADLQIEASRARARIQFRLKRLRGSANAIFTPEQVIAQARALNLCGTICQNLEPADHGMFYDTNENQD